MTLLESINLDGIPNTLGELSQKQEDMNSNRLKHPDCWAFFEEHARNMDGEAESSIGRYRVPKPDMSGDFIYHDRVEVLFCLLLKYWYKPRFNSPSVYGQVQFITQNLK